MPFSISISTEKKQILKKLQLYPQRFFYEREERSPNLFLRGPGDEDETLKKQLLLMVLKLSVSNNINIKKRTRNKVINIANPKSSSKRPFESVLDGLFLYQKK